MSTTKRNAWHNIKAEMEKLKKENEYLRSREIFKPAYDEMTKALGIMFIHNDMMKCKSRVELTELFTKTFGPYNFPWMKMIKDDFCHINNLPFAVKNNKKEQI